MSCSALAETSVGGVVYEASWRSGGLFAELVTVTEVPVECVL